MRLQAHKPWVGHHFRTALATNAQGELWILSSMVKNSPSQPFRRKRSNEQTVKNPRRMEFFTWDGGRK